MHGNGSTNGHLAPVTRPIRVAQFGLGPIGIASLRLAAAQPWIQIVGGVDIDPAKVGRPLAEVAGLATPDEVRVFASFEELWKDAPPDVLLHTAGSRADETLTQIEPALRRGVSVATTCEQMLYPALTSAEQARQADQLCRDSGGRVVGTGVNPGFVLDVLPVCLTGVCRQVRGIYGERVVNASTRRGPLQRKIGSGMAPETFREGFRQGKAGHAGFKESLALIAHALGWTIGPIEETCEPVIAERAIVTDHFQVAPGQTAGLHQRVTAEAAHGPVIELDLKMYLDAPDPHDAVRIEGDPPVEAMVPGGIAGDDATVAALINVIPRLLAAAPGVKLMTDLPVPVCAAGNRVAAPAAMNAANPAVVGGA